MAGRRADRLACLMAVALLLGSGVALLGALRYEPWLRYALRIETAASPPDMPQAVRERLSAELARKGAAFCGQDLPESRVTVAMDLLRRSLADAVDSPLRTSAERSARDTVREALLCNPADGNLWYLEALLEQRAGRDWSRVEELLLVSAALSPRETNTLAKRARLIALALRQPDAALPLDLEADLRRAAALAKVEPAAAALASLRAGGHGALADALVADLPEDRRAALASGTSWQRSTFGRAERYRTFDYRPFGEPDR